MGNAPLAMQFFGAARHVTGTKHLLHIRHRTGPRQILLDCGMVQGPRRIAIERNLDLGGLRADAVDAVLLSHAHIDHSGSLPRLTKLGFSGRIHCTEATRDLLGLMLPDSAHIQRQDFKYLKKRGKRVVEPPYDSADVEATLRQTKGHRYYERIEVLEGVHATFLDAGHILGSAGIVLDIDGDVTGCGRDARIYFTGDLGRAGLPILRDPDPPPPDCDVLITESTYGNRLHEPIPDLERALGDAVRREMSDGGRIVIPAFAVGRTQAIILFLGNLMATGKLPRQPIWVDSPLATGATKILSRHEELFDIDLRRVLHDGREPFFFDGLRYVADAEESRTLNGTRSGIIIAASGMCEGGRVLHHLRATLPRPEDAVVFVGYQAQGTLGRRLVDGFDSVRVLGERFRVRCRIVDLGGFSAHADRDEILTHLAPLADRVRQTFIVHGEEQPAHALADALEENGFGDIQVPVRRERFELLPPV